MPWRMRLKLTIEYAGTRYSGWQIQKNARTIQGELDRAIREASGVRVSLQSGLRVPPGGIVVHSPFAQQPSQALVNGDAMPVSSSGAVVLRSLPAEVVFRR